MKLNNKGFAISSIMYLILVLTIILIAATLSILGSRKLILDKTKDEALNDIYTNAGTTSSTPICEIVSGDIYAAGAEYACELGDGETRTFYVLEDGDNTTLTKGTTGTAGPGELSLIMDRNIDEEPGYWCDQSGSNPSSNSCAGDKAKAALKEKTSGWTNSQILSINLPTGYQIARVVGDTSWTTSNSSNISLTSTPWLYGNLKSDAAPYGYWTSNAYALNTISAWRVLHSGTLDISGVYYNDRNGIRPVITISKDKINFN